MTLRKDEDGVPFLLKWLVYAIERVGFPVFACGAMFYLGHQSMARMTTVLADVTRTLSEFREQVRQDHAVMLRHVADDTKRIEEELRKR